MAINYVISGVGLTPAGHIKYNVQFYNDGTPVHLEDFVLGRITTLRVVVPAVLDRDGNVIEQAVTEDAGIRFFVHQQITRFIDTHLNDLLRPEQRTSRLDTKIVVDRNSTHPWIVEVKGDGGRLFER